jgi:hypothetical protein
MLACREEDLEASLKALRSAIPDLVHRKSQATSAAPEQLIDRTTILRSILGSDIKHIGVSIRRPMFLFWVHLNGITGFRLEALGSS